MSFTGKDLEVLADEGFAMIEKANEEVTQKFIDFHKERCVNTDRDTTCEKNFLKAMLLLLDVRAAKVLGLAEVVEEHMKEYFDPNMN